ncbi:MAG: hypothetical protein FWF69_01315, partial [Firmicutes bacterium]|nr:hypothetical protein [Bacillota bacterium]
MNLNLQDILGYILPLVQDQKKDDAKKMLTKTLEPEKRSLLSSVVGALGMKQNPLELANLSSVLPSLLAMIKPEHIAAAQKFFTDLIQGKTPKTDAPAAKKTATKTSSAAAAPA